MRTIQEKREAAQARIDQAIKRVQDGIAEGLPYWIIKARRNSVAVATSDAAMLEAFIMRGEA